MEYFLHEKRGEKKCNNMSSLLFQVHMLPYLFPHVYTEVFYSYPQKFTIKYWNKNSLLFLDVKKNLLSKAIWEVFDRKQFKYKLFAGVLSTRP